MAPCIACAALLACGNPSLPLDDLPDGMVQSTTVVARTPVLSSYPCMAQCHLQRTPNPTRRELREFHVSRRVNHGPLIDWCQFCHDLNDLDHLHLINGTPIPFNEAYRLCGQCHAEKYRDWGRGVHGSQIGAWAGARQRRSCPLCHDPHDPHRHQIESLPPPRGERHHLAHERTQEGHDGL
ncbi:MAG: hypothetical protein WCJ30_04965 [Deltaproteobacteria bacterium]